MSTKATQLTYIEKDERHLVCQHFGCIYCAEWYIGSRSGSYFVRACPMHLSAMAEMAVSGAFDA